MSQFAVSASLISLALSIFVGVRLLIAAVRTRRAPEVAMGTYQALVVAAIVVYAVLQRKASVAPEWQSFFSWVVFANALIGLGVIALAIGIWRIYRSSEPWGAPLCVVLSIWVVASWAWTAMGDVVPTTVAPTWPNACFVAARSSVYLWGAVEAIRFYGMMNRRAALGLGDAVVANQVLMWGLFSLSMGTLAIASLSAGVILGEGYTSSIPARFLTPTMSLVAAICLWLGFFPPAFYRRMVGGEAASASTS
jgi:hypothetical protein